MNKRTNATIADVTSIVTKGTTPTTLGRNFTLHGIGFIKAECITNDGALIKEKQVYIDEETDGLMKRSRLQKDDVLFSIAGVIGRTALVKQSALPANTNQAIAILRPNTTRISPEFLYYTVRSKEFQDHSLGHVVQTAQANVSLGVLSAAPIWLPPISVQKRIADILAAYDSLIENSRLRMNILESMCRVLYRGLFMDFRFNEIETRPVPQGWEFGHLEDFLDVLETGNRPKGGVSDITEGVPSIGAESIVGIGRFDFSKTKYIPRAYFDSMRSGVVQDRDVLVYKDGGRPGIFTPHIALFGAGFPFDEMAINSHVYRLRGKDGISQEYLYFYLSSNEVLHWMHMHGSGVAIPSLARSDLKKLPFLRPDATLLNAFDRHVRPMVVQILGLARQIQNLRRTRDLLLPRLLSGQIAVEVEAA